MLGFFRKYQKFFFVIVTIVIVVSFSFFGTFTTMSRQEPLPDRVLLLGLRETPMMERELATVCKLVAMSPVESEARARGRMPHLLNDQVLEKELMATGMAMMVARSYFDELKPDLEQRLEKVRNYRPYRCAQHPHIGVEGIWSRWAPEIYQNLALLQTRSGPITEEVLSTLIQLYLAQATLPSSFLKQVLMYQFQQQGLPMDPALEQIDLALFGFHSLEDWFGPRFVSLMGQYIMNAAFWAKAHGYDIPLEAVRKDLYRNIAEGYRQQMRQETLKAEDLQAHYEAELHAFGGDERLLLNGWRSIMLFRNMLHDIGRQMVLDPLAFEQFHHYTKQALELDLYALPIAAECRTLLDLFELQLYLEAVSEEPVKGKNILQLPSKLASYEQIAKRAPECVYQPIDIEYGMVDRQEVIRSISVRETWDWELGDTGWSSLQKKFPKQLTFAATKEARLKLLDQCSATDRSKIDAYAREQILEDQPDRLLAALDKASYRSQSIQLRTGSSPFAHVTHSERLMNLLKQVPLKEEMGEARNPLDAYSDDGQHYYRFFVLNRSAAPGVFTFAQAKREGILTRWLEKRLEAAYPEIRRKNNAAFAKLEDRWSPTPEMKTLVGRYLFADLLRSIEKAAPVSQGNTQDDFFYVRHRFTSLIADVKKELEESEGVVNPWIVNKGEEGIFENQFKLTSSKEKVERNSPLSFAKEGMFNLPIKGWSTLLDAAPGGYLFYQVLSEASVASATTGEVERGHQQLALDAQRRFTAELLEKIQAKKAIDIEKSLEIATSSEEF